MMAVQWRGCFKTRPRIVLVWCMPRLPIEGGHVRRMFVEDGDGQQTVKNERLMLRQLQNIVAPEILDGVSMMQHLRQELEEAAAHLIPSSSQPGGCVGDEVVERPSV